MSNNCTCNTCGKKFHHCGSCGCDGYSEEGYCSEKCKYESDEVAQAKAEFVNFLDALDADGRRRFKCWFDTYSEGIDHLYTKWLEEYE